MEPYEGDGLFKDYFLSFSDQKGKKKKKDNYFSEQLGGTQGSFFVLRCKEVDR